MWICGMLKGGKKGEWRGSRGKKEMGVETVVKRGTWW